MLDAFFLKLVMRWNLRAKENSVQQCLIMSLSWRYKVKEVLDSQKFFLLLREIRALKGLHTKTRFKVNSHSHPRHSIFLATHQTVGF